MAVLKICHNSISLICPFFSLKLTARPSNTSIVGGVVKTVNLQNLQLNQVIHLRSIS